jgi:hypothetical protein
MATILKVYKNLFFEKQLCRKESFFYCSDICGKTYRGRKDAVRLGSAT